MPLYANVGIPMICLYWPPAWIAFIPVVAIESWLGSRLLKKPLAACFKATLVANLISTLIGIPVTWLLLAIVEAAFFGGNRGLATFPAQLFAVTLQSPWLVPYEEDLVWMIPVATLFLSLPFYAMSVVTEAPVAHRFLSDVPRKEIYRWARWANCASYVFLVGLVLTLNQTDHLQWVYVLLDPLIQWIIELFYFIIKACGILRS